MLYFSKLRILFITLFSVLFILIALSNLFKFDDNFFDKKINLGLDLQGGSYLLLEIDTEPLIKERLQEKIIPIKNIGSVRICPIEILLKINPKCESGSLKNSKLNLKSTGTEG